ncbi:hypothetical protein [Cellulomonas fimi]|uniref:Uncharacterized protein n=1 Tax=Cellulomonas fimi (strain ATCC 484 / DSM 20113 / JCM 1341 / CCUG 24087 / LMG 16345 / NBRC 15513 / NCIMB 8980 / NCTC 7547 / NRS-133) TaxID=590998 RepID=F4GZA7_CELFA|nr:hypothetical protein [Cellulomonas fimi]AEE47223.1 hypothetical protein Celf_3108 [Cellulomonas fimi ATCC 484]NNH08456.1 hypothetical protein [Cellulomonas fimi]VEH35638.1 Uncharacterised protein [Cellulomonas fimi]
MITRSGSLSADYSQVELHLGDGGDATAEDLGVLGEWPALMTAWDHLVLTTARQHGTLPFEVQVHDGPVPLDPAWDTVHEASVRLGPGARMTGWAGEGEVVDVPVEDAATYRLRYVVEGGQEGSRQFRDGSWDDEPLERYMVQVWPDEPREAVVVATVPWSQFWAFGPDAVRLVAELQHVPDPERLTVLVDAALAAHPDVAARLRAGDDRYTLGIRRYVGELFRVTYALPVYAEQRTDHEGLQRLILDRAAR